MGRGEQTRDRLSVAQARYERDLFKGLAAVGAAAGLVHPDGSVEVHVGPVSGDLAPDHVTGIADQHSYTRRLFVSAVSIRATTHFITRPPLVIPVPRHDKPCPGAGHSARPVADPLRRKPSRRVSRAEWGRGLSLPSLTRRAKHGPELSSGPCPKLCADFASKGCTPNPRTRLHSWAAY